MLALLISLTAAAAETCDDEVIRDHLTQCASHTCTHAIDFGEGLSLRIRVEVAPQADGLCRYRSAASSQRCAPGEACAQISPEVGYTCALGEGWRGAVAAYLGDMGVFRSGDWSFSTAPADLSGDLSRYRRYTAGGQEVLDPMFAAREAGLCVTTSDGQPVQLMETGRRPILRER